MSPRHVTTQQGPVAATRGDEARDGGACTPTPDTGSSHANPNGPRQPPQYCVQRGRGGGRA
eukprot:3230515-Lingulodinium_polyedra.AAC.1